MFVHLLAPFSIISIGVVHTNGSHDVEVELETSSALGKEIILHAAFETPFAKAFLIEDAQVERLVVPFLKTLVGKIDEDNEAFLLSDEFVGRIVFAVGATTRTSTHHIALTYGGLSLQCIYIRVGVATC